MAGMLVGYARVSTDTQDLTAQRDALAALGVTPDRIYVDHGLTGTNRERPGLREALAACRAGDTLVVAKLDRLARSLPDARAIAEELTAKKVKLSLGGSVHDPTDPVGRLLFNVLAMVAEFEADLARMRTREGMKVAKAKGRLRGKQPKLKPGQEKHLVALYRAGDHTIGELEELFGITRSTVYRAVTRAGGRDPLLATPQQLVTPTTPTPATPTQPADTPKRQARPAPAKAPAPAAAADNTTSAAEPRTKRSRQPGWFLVEGDTADKAAPVVVLSSHTTEKAALTALTRAHRRTRQASDIGTTLHIRPAAQIAARLEWDPTKNHGVIHAGPPTT